MAYGKKGYDKPMRGGKVAKSALSKYLKKGDKDKKDSDSSDYHEKDEKFGALMRRLRKR